MNSSSRVVRLVDVRSTPTNLLWNLFTHACSQNKIPTPTPMLAHSDSGSPASLSGGIWAVFSTHEDARAALNLGCDIFTVSPALESDLSMLPALKRLHIDQPERDVPPRHANNYLPPLVIPDMLASQDIYSTGGPRSPFHNRGPGQHGAEPNSPSYTISSNPPNPKTSFRAGDWMCSAPNCSAHNFQRNIACIVCGRPRSGGVPPLSVDAAHPPNYPLANPSPRFAGRYNGAQGAPQTPLSALPSPVSATGFPFIGSSGGLSQPPLSAPGHAPSKAPPPQYPPLTPSGRALSVGGRVRNISRDPLSPCVMYWPDNEPLPEPGQIRPIDSALITYPPIINTGNKGAAEKQPGDWICRKCNYHNWRRRKVCQTCFPYAEGNGDSISAAVQAERIALLANVLANQFNNALDLNALPAPQNDAPNARHQLQQPPHSAPPFQVRTNVPMGAAMPGNNAFVRGDSRDSSPLSEHFPFLPLGEQEHDKDALPIYQTSGGRGAPPFRRGNTLPLPPSADSRFGPVRGQLSSSPPVTRTLLPSFLQDIVHSPSLSPSSASSSSADLSFDGSSEDAHYASSSGTSTHSHTIGGQQQQQQQQHGLYGASAHNASTSSFNSLSGRGNANIPGSIWQFDGEESRTLSSTSGPSSAGPTPAPYARQSPPHVSSTAACNINGGGLKTSPTTSPRASDATPKSTNDFWQVRYN
ncbi:hypothetical protein C8Q77DRAFT_1218344 [Trametes polyzona]|nr:hypothetical protein C8Q77DRAFT_1218344 [Trametes polyzona]